MTIYEYLQDFEVMTFDILIEEGLTQDKIEEIYDRVDSTFNYVVESLKEKQIARIMKIGLKKKGAENEEKT